MDKIEELMKQADYWLNNPELQHRITGREITFIASVHLQYRQGKKLSLKQLQYVEAILRKHSK